MNYRQKKAMQLLFLTLISITALLSCDKTEKLDPADLDVEKYIELLKADKYDSTELPPFSYKDIPALLEYRNDKEVITDFPRNGISSFWQSECNLGMYALWTIESIRAVSINSEFLIGRFPSLNPILQKIAGDWSGEAYSSAAHEIASKAYFDWWEENKQKEFDAFKDIDPLNGTEYRWH
ncbi:MAG: DUF4943 family protein [Saprospiraceae bacterium]|nr:DUF4943 family protein [Saprospiraceae bacterium]